MRARSRSMSVAACLLTLSACQPAPEACALDGAQPDLDAADVPSPRDAPPDLGGFDAPSMDAPSLDAVVVSDAPGIDASSSDASVIDTSVADASIDASTPAPNVVFVTSTAHAPAELGGLAGADAICNALASGAGLPGRFVAWLSTSTVDARDRLAGARGFVRMDGLVIADTIGELVTSGPRHPIVHDEHGINIAVRGADGVTQIGVLTGTSADGTLGSTGSCDDWTSATPTVGTGRQNGIPGTCGDLWTGDGLSNACTQGGRLYCFQNDANVELGPPVPLTGRTIFLSTNAFDPASGVDGADALCAADAARAGLGGTFVALLPTLTASAVSRVDRTGAPWVDVRGRLVARAHDLGGLALLAPIEVMADGALPDEFSPVGIAIGTTDLDLPTTSAMSCDEWTDAAGTIVTTSAVRASPWPSVRFFNSVPTLNPSCGSLQRVVCLEP